MCLLTLSKPDHTPSRPLALVQRPNRTSIGQGTVILMAAGRLLHCLALETELQRPDLLHQLQRRLSPPQRQRHCAHCQLVKTSAKRPR